MRLFVDFIRDRGVLLVTALLCAQAVAYHRYCQNEREPAVAPLAELPVSLDRWNMIEETRLDPYAASILNPDDSLLRVYQNVGTSVSASLFIAYFRSQRTDKAPHSPKNCLPGHGWTPNKFNELSIVSAGSAQQFPVNRYVVAKGESKSVVIYWYQTARRAVANEYAAKIYLVSDAIRDQRSDTALVRIIVPVAGKNEAAAEQAAVEFSGVVFAALQRHIPM
jgi:EpsI family protein